MSAARSLKIPAIPVAEAIASICKEWLRKFGLRFRPLELELHHPVGSAHQIVDEIAAARFSRTLRTVC